MYHKTSYTFINRTKMSCTIVKTELENTKATRNDFIDALITIYSYLKDSANCDLSLSSYSFDNNILQIPFEECLECKSIYFHNPLDCGIDDGEGYENKWKCGRCTSKYIDADLITFDSERMKSRKEKKEAITDLNEDEKCPICLDELQICEVSGFWGIEEQNVKLSPCNHVLCRKCYFDLKNTLTLDTDTDTNTNNFSCPLCRTVVVDV